MIDFLRVTPKRRNVRLKHKSGVIYHNPPVSLKMIFYLANSIIIGCVIYLGYLYFPLGLVTWNYFINREDRRTVSINENKVIEKRSETVEIKETIPDKFRIEIPKIKADTWVVTNVDPFNKEEYINVLSQGVIAQAKGSGLPGGGLGTSIYMFAHSSEPIASAVRNNPVFYLLGEMTNDDKIIIDYNGRKYVYQVYDKKVVSSNDTDYLTYADPSKEVVILQTCWPIGTNWKRLLVFGKLVLE